MGGHPLQEVAAEPISSQPLEPAAWRKCVKDPLVIPSIRRDVECYIHDPGNCICVIGMVKCVNFGFADRRHDSHRQV